MKLLLLGVSLFAASLATVRGQALLGYWDFNGNLDRSAGAQGTLQITFDGFGIGFEDYSAGTSVNLPGGFVAGSSRGFFDLAQIDETTRVSILDLDFSGLTAPTISFAARNDGVLQVGDRFDIEYNTGSGWTHATDLEDPESSFGLYSYTFDPGVLDGLSSVGIRITHATAVTALNLFEIDNVQITAVPEPASAALVAAGMLLVGWLYRRKRFQ